MLQQRNSSLRIPKINLNFTLLFILFLFNILFAFFPLTNIIGYEFSVINSFLFFILSGISAIHNSKLIEISNGYLLEHLKKTKILFLCTILFPLASGITSTLLMTECPINDGILFYFIISIPSLFFGYVSGILITTFFNRFNYFIFVVLAVFFLSLPLIEFYFNPQIYFYNIIFGYFPGTIYDEDLAVNNILVSYRLFHLAIFIGILLIINFYRIGQINKIRSLSIILIVGLLFFLLKPALNFSTDLRVLKKHLNKSLETEHFKLLYPDSIDRQSAELSALLHEYYFEQVTHNLESKTDMKITSLVFESEEQKRELFGAGRADVAKPWLQQIYLNYPGYTSTLKHEIVHILAGEFGVTPFMVADNLNPAMIEGLAMAIEDNFDDMPVHSMAKLARTAGFKTSLQNLFSGFKFFSQNSSISYVYAGSFLKYLIDNYGVEKVKVLYGNLNFEQVLKKSLIELENEYNTFINDIEIDFNKHTAQLYFGGQTIFKKHCARTAAHRTKNAWMLYNQKKYSEAEKEFNRVYEYSGSYQSLIGLVNSKIQLKNYESALDIISMEMKNFLQTPYLYMLELTTGDLLVRNNKTIEAREWYDSLLVQLPTIDYQNEVLLRKALNDLDLLKDYLEGNRKKRLSLLMQLNEKLIYYESIPVLLRYCKDREEIEIALNSLNSRVNVTDESSSYAVMKLSQAAVKIGKYKNAQELAIKSLSIGNKGKYIHSLIENLRMINWLNNFADEIKVSFVFE